MAKRIFFLTSFLLHSCLYLSAQFLSNPSFEGPTGLSVTPPGWFPCGQYSTPDTQPTLDGWNFTKSASNGNSYLGIITRGDVGTPEVNYTTEGCGTHLTQPLKKGLCYRFTIDLATFSNAEYVLNSTFYNSPINLTVWLANSACGKTKLLWTSPVISDDNWKPYSFQASMDDNYEYLLFEAEFPDANNKKSGNILIDNFRLELMNRSVSLGDDLVICDGAPTQINVPATIDNIVWWNGTSDRAITVSSAGNYSATLQVGACYFTDTIVVKSVKPPVVSFEATPILCRGDTVRLNVSTPFGTYAWNTGSTSPAITVKEGGTYGVVVQNTCGSASGETKVSYLNDCCSLDVPNVFTPNGDGYNELFEMQTEASVISFDLVIYNRWGKQVFAAKRLQDFWDGKSGGQDVSPGIYFWDAILRCSHRSEILENKSQGFVVVIR